MMELEWSEEKKFPKTLILAFEVLMHISYCSIFSLSAHRVMSVRAETENCLQCFGPICNVCLHAQPKPTLHRV